MERCKAQREKGFTPFFYRKYLVTRKCFSSVVVKYETFLEELLQRMEERI